MKQNNVNTDGLLIDDEGCTGQAYILSLTETADNSIVIVGGANQ